MTTNPVSLPVDPAPAASTSHGSASGEPVDMGTFGQLLQLFQSLPSVGTTRTLGGALVNTKTPGDGEKDAAPDLVPADQIVEGEMPVRPTPLETATPRDDEPAPPAPSVTPPQAPTPNGAQPPAEVTPITATEATATPSPTTVAPAPVAPTPVAATPTTDEPSAMQKAAQPWLSPVAKVTPKPAPTPVETQGAPAVVNAADAPETLVARSAVADEPEPPAGVAPATPDAGGRSKTADLPVGDTVPDDAANLQPPKPQQPSGPVADVTGRSDAEVAPSIASTDTAAKKPPAGAAHPMPDQAVDPTADTAGATTTSTPTAADTAPSSTASDAAPRASGATPSGGPAPTATPAPSPVAAVAAPVVTTAPAPAAQAAPVATIDALPHTIAMQVREAPNDALTPLHRAIVRLDPPELGSVTLEIRGIGDDLSIVARAESAEAARALMRQRGEIQIAVANLGMSVSDFDVQHGNGGDQHQAPRGRGDRNDEQSSAQPGPYERPDTTQPEGELFL